MKTKTQEHLKIDKLNRLINYLAPWIFLWKHSNCGGGRVRNMQKQFKSIKGLE